MSGFANSERLIVGVDVGSISVKIAVVGVGAARDRMNEIPFEEKGYRIHEGEDVRVALSPYRRHLGRPRAAAVEMLAELFSFLPEERADRIAVTGSGGKHLAASLGTGHKNEFRAVAAGVNLLHPEVRTILEMGGENSKYIRMTPTGDGSTGIVDYETNGDCAAGTGSFMDQQATRLLYTIEEVGDVVTGATRTPTIAGRCSVFAKSDMIHAQQKGYQPPEVLKGLCEAVARNYKASIIKGKEIDPPVAFLGGVSANRGVVGAMRSLLGLEGEAEFFVPEYYAWLTAIGAALLSAREDEEGERFTSPASIRIDTEKEAESFPRSGLLSMEKVVLLRDRIRPYRFPDGEERVDAWLGIDIGSVSTNLVVTDDDLNVIHEIYTRTEARPIEVVDRGLKEIERAVGDRIRIRGVGTTGSGRELIGELIGADTINDEITAHKTGASSIGRKMIDHEVDTIFEIGGQDSKYISIEDGVVVDFAMNEACAAGTGSFLEEQAERLDISIKDEFSRLALSSTGPIRLGERCTVFIEKDLIPYLQKGAKKEDLVAGLAYSIAINYLNRVVRGRHIGDVIYFQGGTAYNDSVAAAFATILDKEVIVPPHNGVVGAIGMAILARQKVLGTGRTTTFRGYALDQVDYSIRDFTCKGCGNFCEIQEFTVEGEKTYWGDKCSERFRKKRKVDRKPVIGDLIRFREERLLRDHEPEAEGAPRIGMPRAMYFYDRFPFWNRLFREVGCRVVISDPTTKEILNRGLDTTVAEPCFPIKVAHGHVSRLLDEEIDVLFMPNVINAETDTPEFESFLCPWGQTLPFVIGQSGMRDRIGDRMLAPNIHFRDGMKRVKKEMAPVWERIGVPRRQGDRALEAAYEAQRDFDRALLAEGEKALRTLEERGEPGIILFGRPYNMYDRGVNMNVPTKLREQYGVNVIPLDFLPLGGVDMTDVNDNMYWNYGRKILQAAKFVKERPGLHVIYITNFKCGPDSYIKHYIRRASGKPFLSLTIDGHANDAGAMTRCEAYLDSKGFLRRWTGATIAEGQGR